MKDITVEDLFTINNLILVDVRSPIEFNEGSIPGAVNFPLFSDEERKEIGIIYKQFGQAAAKWRAMEIVSPKLPSLLGGIKELTEKGLNPVIHCWRGGMRSKAVATFIEYAGVPSARLVGGYKAYRQYTIEQLPKLLPEKAIVLHGMTGVGKTDILRTLGKRGYQILDLEQMANHRGSVFGSIGIGEGCNQKAFDANLFTCLSSYTNRSYFIMEAESKRIGRVIQPEILLEKKQSGIHIFIQASLENRVKRIFNEYVVPSRNNPMFETEILEKITKLKCRIKNEELKLKLENLLETKDYKGLIEILLENYYDPRYDHKRLEYTGDFIYLDGNDLSEAVIKLEQILGSLGCFITKEYSVKGPL